MGITVPELTELSTRNVTMCSARSPDAGPYEQPYRNWQSSVPEMSPSVLSIIQVPVRDLKNNHTGTGTERSTGISIISTQTGTTQLGNLFNW